MPLDNLHEQLEGLNANHAPSPHPPPAFLRRVARRRWARRATTGGLAVIVIGTCVALAIVYATPAPNRTPIVLTPPPAPSRSPVTAAFDDTSLVMLNRAGLSARVLQDPRPSVPGVLRVVERTAEPPLRAFDVARVLRGL